MNKIIENIDYSNISRPDISLTNSAQKNDHIKIFLEYTFCANANLNF